MKDLNFEQVSFTIIAHAGEAKGKAMAAIKCAKEGNYKKAQELIVESEKSLAVASHTHMDIISAEASGEKITIPVLFMHAEDQLLTTETVILLSKEIIEIHEKINK